MTQEKLLLFKIYWSFLCSIFICCTFAVAQEHVNSNAVPAVIANAQSSVSKIIYIEDDKEIPRGTGFIINHNILVTSLHNVVNENGLYPLMSIKAAPVSEHEDKLLQVTGVKALSFLHDFILFEVEDYHGPSLSLGNLLPQENEVYAIGFPNNELQTVISNQVSLLNETIYFPGNTMYMGGISGGPVLNTYGEIIGIATTTSANYIGAIPSIHIQNLLNKLNSSPDIKLSGEELFRQEMNRLHQLDTKNNNSNAQYTLGLIYENRWGVKQDYEKAAKKFKKAADQGHALSRRQLGYLYFRAGDDLRKKLEAMGWNTEKALELLKQAAHQGDIVSHYLIGLVYSTKHNKQESDVEEAKKWLTLPANHGHADALFSLGLLYDGENEEGDKKAIELHQMAINQANHPDALLSLFTAYYNGDRSVEKNYDKAAKCLIRAAKQGHELSINMLGSIVRSPEYRDLQEHLARAIDEITAQPPSNDKH